MLFSLRGHVTQCSSKPLVCICIGFWKTVIQWHQCEIKGETKFPCWGGLMKIPWYLADWLGLGIESEM